MEIVSYPAIFQQKNNQIEVDFPDLPEAFTQGKNMETAMEFAKLGLAITLNDKLGHFEKAPQVTGGELKQIEQNRWSVSFGPKQKVEVSLK